MPERGEGSALAAPGVNGPSYYHHIIWHAGCACEWWESTTSEKENMKETEMARACAN